MLAITGGQVWTMAGKVYPRATILVDGDKIRAVGPEVKIPATGAEVIDATGKLVLPGFIDAHCHLGIMEEIYRVEGDDTNETTDPVTPHLRVVDAINPDDIGFDDAVAGGVTTVVVAPGSANIIGGEIAVLKTRGEVIDDMIIRAPAGLKAALGENPKRNYGDAKKMPATRMASAALLRETLVEAQNYIKRREKPCREGGAEVERNLKLEAVARVLRRKVPLRVHVHRADDIMTAIRIAREFHLSLILEHCTEGHRVAKYIAAAGVPAVVGPVITNRAKVELKDRSLETAAALARAGVSFAIMTDHPVVPIQYLSLSAGLACRGGLPEEKALEAITIGAARVLGLDKSLGSLEPGKDADIVIMDGHPFDLRSTVKNVLINGRQVI